MPDIFDNMVDAYRGAFMDVKDATGQISDPEMAAYDKLDKAGFDEIRKKYGLDHLIDYVRRMEAKRQGVR